MNTIRCAIYTRKSSDEGLEQDFNSLDAQREACAAYVLSQASEGWKLLPELYDDGGLSGGTLERPALKRLLADIKLGRIDTIVVYKVDRLTRSLIDFSKLVEAFDADEVSFVSVTQSFNTTTSMGRLTLNMLLSFAQFEREVTAERIRDKIAASKAKGMWMGGTPPLGYEPKGRSLEIVADHAAIIRDIYARYAALGNVRLVADALEAEGIGAPFRTSRKNQTYGGCRFTRGQLYAILKNPVYAGDIRHKDKIYPGNHKPIIDRDDWDTVQKQLSDHVKGTRKKREQNASLLSGLLFDGEGEPLIAVHSTKGAQRYRYYVSKAHQHKIAPPSSKALRLPANDIEQVVCQELASLLDDPTALLARCAIPIAPAQLQQISDQGALICAKVKMASASKMKALLSSVAVHPGHLVLTLDTKGLAKLLGIALGPDSPLTIEHRANARLKRSGSSIRLIKNNGSAASSAPDQTLTNLLIKARRWWSELSEGETDITTLARREGISSSYIVRVVRLAFLAPAVVQAIQSGKARADLDGRAMLATDAVSPHWEDQVARFLPMDGC